jgi:hypothetical protein
MDAVSEIVTLRAHEPDGLSRMLGASVLAHAMLIAGALVAPADW